ncbi:unnamed protein product, partial [Medioppia subpectinata]
MLANNFGALLTGKHIPGGLQSVEHVFCPFNGRYRFTYGANNGDQHCDQNYSELSNCPHGNALGAKFRKCNFPNFDIHFLCLGDWESSAGSGERFLALMDLRDQPEARPKYRCGLYSEDPKTGKINVSLSADSTCSAQLKSADIGFETLTLSPVANKPLPLLAVNSKCRFPDWMQGKWQQSNIDGNRLVFQDETNQFRTITSRCIMRQNNTPNERFIVHSVTQCGDQSYTCIWIKKRSPNILEFQFAEKSSEVMTESLCNDNQFTSNWITQGKGIAIASSTSCPITGDYSGVVPGASGLCAKVASDCNNPDIMFYSVSSCENRTHVYEVSKIVFRFAIDIEVETKEHNRLLDNVLRFEISLKLILDFFSVNKPVVFGRQDLVVGCVSASYQYGSRVMAGRGGAGDSIGLMPGAGNGLIGGYTDGWCGGIGKPLSGFQLGRIGT